MLFFKECKKILRSLTFWIYCIFVVLMFATQYYADCSTKEYAPSQYEEDYGYKIVEDHELIMNQAVNNLMSEYSSNRYACYPFGFYKSVSLKEKSRKNVEKYLMELTGTDYEEFEKLIAKGEKNYVSEGINEYETISFDDVKVNKDITYERFTEIMSDIDDILGGGSAYKTKSLVYNYARVPMTYEDAVKEYEVFINEEKITGALSRLFCDYMGIVLAFLPVFVAVALTISDKRYGMSELIYSRKISSSKLIFTRYTALVIMTYIPVLITMIVALIQALNIYSDNSLNIAVMFTLPTFWLLPEIMITTAMGILLTEIFSSGTAILVQVIWAFLSLITGSSELSGNIGKYNLICRHNTLGGRDVFIMEYGNFIFNRIFFAVLSIIIIILSAYLYNLKRGGKFNGIKLFGEGGLLRHKA